MTFLMKRTVPAAVLMTVAAMTVTTAATAQAAPAQHPSSTYVVTAAPGQVGRLADDLAEDDVRVVRELNGIDMAVVRATAAEASRLSVDPRVRAVTPDSQVQLLADTYAPYNAQADANSMYSVTDTISARSMWRDARGRERWTGKGIDIAVLDSGITPVEGLATPGKIVNGPDLSFESQSPALRYLDGFGHGTHMAGIIAGKDTGANPATADATPFLGVAPDARLVNVKVADALGNADVSQIIAGIDWVVQNRKSAGLNIRVLNLSLGTPSRQSYLVDPLAYAAEQAWHKGIVVVAAAGNDGTGTGKLLNPAMDPYVIAVGANDSKATKSTDDDVIPDFSTRGDRVRNPDLVAHGMSIQSLRVPGSFIDQEFGATAAINERFLRGSGTSQAAAVVSGGVALMLQSKPSMTPDQVKSSLTLSARRLPVADLLAQGRGMIDLRRAALASYLPLGMKQRFPTAQGTGSLDAARGEYRLQDDNGDVLIGEQDIFGSSFGAAKHAQLSAADAAWTGGTWNGSTWTGTTLTPTGWAAVTWSGDDWSGSPWTARTWASGTWTSRTWADGYWESRTWASRTWASRTWASGGWQ
jgi:serine protease AprX